jgi:probable phosphoglycerate mutase
MNTEPAPIALFRRPCFYFLRHGQSRLNAEKRIAGSVDTELTPLGHDQARIAAAILARQPVTAIYASPMQRAHHTAQYVAEALKLPITLIEDIAERHWGALEGEPRAARIPGVLPEGAETFEAFVTRVLTGLAQIDDNGMPLIVAHSGVFRVLCHTLGIKEQEAPISNALPLLFEKQRDGWRMTPVS